MKLGKSFVRNKPRGYGTAKKFFCTITGIRPFIWHIKLDIPYNQAVSHVTGQGVTAMRKKSSAKSLE